MVKYHITKDGAPGVCRAITKDCPLGGEDEHYPTKEAAREAYEKENADHTLPPVNKAENKKTNLTPQEEEEYHRLRRFLINSSDETSVKSGYRVLSRFTELQDKRNGVKTAPRKAVATPKDSALPPASAREMAGRGVSVKHHHRPPNFSGVKLGVDQGFMPGERYNEKGDYWTQASFTPDGKVMFEDRNRSLNGYPQLAISKWDERDQKWYPVQTRNGGDKKDIEETLYKMNYFTTITGKFSSKERNRLKEKLEAAGELRPMFVDLSSEEYTKALLKAPVYSKKAMVTMRVAEPNEKLSTVLADGTVETERILQGGEVIVKNPGGEEYAMEAKKFYSRYQDLGQGVWKALGEVKAIKNPMGAPITIMAPWGEKQYGAPDCYIGMNPVDLKERYLLGAQEFADTYELKADVRDD